MQAGEQLVETNIPASQLSSFVSVADKVAGTPFSRLTLGAPDFERSFSTYPKFDQIHDRINGIIEKQNAPKKPKESKKSEAPKESKDSTEASSSAEAPEDATDVNDAPKLSNGDDVPMTKRDGSPIDEQYLVELEMIGQNTRLAQIAANNDECSVP